MRRKNETSSDGPLIERGALGFYSVRRAQRSINWWRSYHPAGRGHGKASHCCLDLPCPRRFSFLRSGSAELGLRRIHRCPLPAGFSGRPSGHFRKASLYAYRGSSRNRLLKQVEQVKHPMNWRWLYTIIFMQGVAGLRLGGSELPGCARRWHMHLSYTCIPNHAFHLKPKRFSSGRTPSAGVPDDVRVRLLNTKL